jgi:GTP-binding protein
MAEREGVLPPSIQRLVLLTERFRMFYDEAKIYVRGGDGGNGCVSFRREKYVRLGGPNGGNGGHGGDVYLTVDAKLGTLIGFQKHPHWRAPSGGHGKGQGMAGRRGKDLLIRVPSGTVAYDADSGELLADLTEPGQRVLVAGGGRGGRGNAAFKTSTNRSPRLAEKGLQGQERWLRLELKMLADVGIIGLPNAGKSTLLSVVSAARPKIADYPFTTLQPNLGVVSLDDYTSFALADIPGLIEGAHKGAGLGDRFLRHVERTRLLIHLLDGASAHPLADLEQINRELTLFHEQLGSRPQIVVLSKMDLPQAREMWPAVEAALQEREQEAACISAITGQGVRELIGRVAQRLAELPDREEETPIKVFRPRPRGAERAFTVGRRGEAWIVQGEGIERVAAQTDWRYHEAIERFQRILDRWGILGALEEAGVAEGDMVYVGEIELAWQPFEEV